MTKIGLSAGIWPELARLDQVRPNLVQRDRVLAECRSVLARAGKVESGLDRSKRRPCSEVLRISRTIQAPHPRALHNPLPPLRKPSAARTYGPTNAHRPPGKQHVHMRATNPRERAPRVRPGTRARARALNGSSPSWSRGRQRLVAPPLAARAASLTTRAGVPPSFATLCGCVPRKLA